MQLTDATFEDVIGKYRIRVAYGNFKNDYMGCYVGLNHLSDIIVMPMNLMRMKDMTILHPFYPFYFLFR